MFRNIIIFWLYLATMPLGFAQKHRIFQHKDIKNYIAKHQSIAVLPFSVFIERQGKRSDDSLAYSLHKEVEYESNNIPLTCTFLWASKDSETAPKMKSWEKTRELLGKIHYHLTENILADTLQKIARHLQVDALLLGVIDSYEDKYNTNYGRSHVASEEVVTINLFLYDGATGALIWQNEDSSAYSLRLEERMSLGKNAEFILQRMMQVVPYFKGKKRKR